MPKKQLYAITKHDWQAVVRRLKKSGLTTTDYYWATSKKRLMSELRTEIQPGDKVQLFKLSYEFKDAWVVGEKK